MNNSDLIKLLDKSISLSKKTRTQRVMKIPHKMFYLKILELMTLWFKNPVRIKAKTFWNENMFVVLPEIVSVNIYRNGFFEEGLTKMVLEYLKPGMTFFDIGAHFGYFTLLSSVLVGSEGQVHCFEPTPSTFNMLKANVSDKSNVVLNNYAVLSERKIVLLNDFGIEYSAYNSLYKATLSPDILPKIKVNKYEVESISIDDYVDKQGLKPNFIKIDAENSEHNIILGMEKTIDMFHPIISVEVGNIGSKDLDLINSFMNRGYQPFEFKNDKIQRHYLKDVPYCYDNILFLPGK